MNYSLALTMRKAEIEMFQSSDKRNSLYCLSLHSSLKILFNEFVVSFLDHLSHLYV